MAKIINTESDMPVDAVDVLGGVKLSEKTGSAYVWSSASGGWIEMRWAAVDGATRRLLAFHGLKQLLNDAPVSKESDADKRAAVLDKAGEIETNDWEPGGGRGGPRIDDVTREYRALLVADMVKHRVAKHAQAVKDARHHESAERDLATARLKKAGHPVTADNVQKVADAASADRWTTAQQVVEARNAARSDKDDLAALLK